MLRRRKVSRERVKGAIPDWYDPKYEGTEYRIEINSSGVLVLVIPWTPDPGRKIKIEGRALMTISAADASTSIAPWQVITPGALAYLFDKGINADAMNAALRKSFDEEAQRQQVLFEQAKVQFKMKTLTRRASFPIISETNIGNTVEH